MHRSFVEGLPQASAAPSLAHPRPGMVDSIGALWDSRRGRWPYMGVRQRGEALDRALFEADQVELHLAGGARQETDAEPCTALDRQR